MEILLVFWLRFLKVLLLYSVLLLVILVLSPILVVGLIVIGYTWRWVRSWNNKIPSLDEIIMGKKADIKITQKK